MAITIQNLVDKLDPHKVKFQVLTTGACELSLRGGRQGKNPTHLEIKFHSAPENMHKEALIIWVERDDLKQAIKELGGLVHETMPPLQPQ